MSRRDRKPLAMSRSPGDRPKGTAPFRKEARWQATGQSPRRQARAVCWVAPGEAGFRGSRGFVCRRPRFTVYV